jgi:zinc protease
MDRPGAQQSIIVAAELAPPKSDAGDIAFEAFDWAFGGAFISRLNMNLREDKHWSYGARSILYPAVGQRIYFAYAPVQTDKTKESIVEMDKELHEAVGQKPLTAEEITAAKDGMTLTLPGERETMNSVAGAIAEIVRFQLPQDYWDTYAAKVRALTPQQISTAAERYLKPGNMVWVVVGDRAKIESGIRELNMGEVQLMDPDGDLIE